MLEHPLVLSTWVTFMFAYKDLQMCSRTWPHSQTRATWKMRVLLLSPDWRFSRVLSGFRVISVGWFCCFSSVAQSCPTLCNPMNCSTPGFLVLHYLPELAQTHVHWVTDAISSSVAPFSFVFNLSQHQGLSQWVSSSYQVTKILELQLQHESF